MSKEVCCVPGCVSRKGDGVTLHKFPNQVSNQEKFAHWILNIGGAVATMESISVYNNRRVCRRHFENVHLYPKNRLSCLAIPVLHIEGLQIQQIEQPQPVVPAPVMLQPEQINVEYQMSNSIFQSSDMQTQNQVPQHLTQHRSRNLKKSRKLKGAWISRRDMKMLKNMQRKLNKCEKEKLSLKIKYALLKKLTKAKAFEILSKKMSPTAKLFCKMQISQSGKKKQGRRFTLDEKILALSLYKPSPKGYRLLSNMCILPSRKTIQILLSKINLKAGINELLFENLKDRVSEMPALHKYCTLIFDEMAIGPSIAYKKNNDRILGFVDNGDKCEKEFSDHALVFMVRGIFKKYKQPIAYYFCSGSTKAVR